jgi:Cu(I)/Ag(I) efflux system membrane fusion protein
MKKISITKRESVIAAMTLVSGLLLGWLVFHGNGNSSNTAETEYTEHTHEEELPAIWTCSMHPQIRMDEPGQCPICGMDLIPLDETIMGEESVSPDEVMMTEAAMNLADVQTMIVRKDYPVNELYLLGKVKPDERNIVELTARFGGRIEKLFVNFTGQNVTAGEKLAAVYSPVLVTAQRELLEALEYKQSNPEFYKAARNKLKFWDLTDEQIDDIEQAGEAQHYFDVLSPIRGTVMMRHVAMGDYIKEGDALFQVIDLSHLWVMFEAYESDLPWIKNGDKIRFSIRSIPGETFQGMVTFIDPTIDSKTRIARVRVELDNPGLQLKPEMFADGVLISQTSGDKKELLIPRTAVLWTGKRAVVYVKQPGRKQPVFSYREIVLGPEAGKFYAVRSGLKEGEEVVVNGVFKIDADAQLAGKPSMMNPKNNDELMDQQHKGMETERRFENHNSDREYDRMKTDPEEGKTGHYDMALISLNAENSSAFNDQLNNVYQAYLPLKDAFVDSDPYEVAQLAEKVSNALEKADMRLLKQKSHTDWMNQMQIMNRSLDKMINDHNIQTQRKAFAVFNTSFYKSIKQFGLSDVLTYYQYCPMADNNNGAYWLSESEEISNPYFGDEMLRCGETREILEY